MKTKIQLLTIIFITTFTVSVFSQTPFSDGFETGDFSKWDNNVGGTISSAYHHSGNYSDGSQSR